MTELEAIKKAVRAASEQILSLYKTTQEVKLKPGNTPVTEADTSSQKIIQEILQPFGYGWLAEETTDDGSRLAYERVWVVDPLDGTKDFLQGTDEFSVMVALLEKGEPILSGIGIPTENSLFYAEKGKGAFREMLRADEKDTSSPTKLRVRSETNPEDLTMMVSRNHLLDEDKRFAEKMQVGNLATCGSAGVKISRLVTKQGDIYINSSDKTGEWDMCAGQLLLHEAGGVVTDLYGKSLEYNKKDPYNRDGFLAATRAVHKEAVAVMQTVL